MKLCTWTIWKKCKKIRLARHRTHPKRLGLARFFRIVKTIILNNSELDLEALVDVEFSVYQRFAHSLEVFGNLMDHLGLDWHSRGIESHAGRLTARYKHWAKIRKQLLSGFTQCHAGYGYSVLRHLAGRSISEGCCCVYSRTLNQNGVESLEDSLTEFFW